MNELKNTKMNYTASVRVKGRAEIWTLGNLEGRTHSDRAKEIDEYLSVFKIAPDDYELVHYAPMAVHTILIEDIFLN